MICIWIEAMTKHFWSPPSPTNNSERDCLIHSPWESGVNTEEANMISREMCFLGLTKWLNDHFCLLFNLFSLFIFHDPLYERQASKTFECTMSCLGACYCLSMLCMCYYLSSTCIMYFFVQKDRCWNLKGILVGVRDWNEIIPLRLLKVLKILQS